MRRLRLLLVTAVLGLLIGCSNTEVEQASDSVEKQPDAAETQRQAEPMRKKASSDDEDDDMLRLD